MFLSGDRSGQASSYAHALDQSEELLADTWFLRGVRRSNNGGS